MNDIEGFCDNVVTYLVGKVERCKKLKAHKGALALAHFFQTRSQKIGHEVERRIADTHGHVHCHLHLGSTQEIREPESKR